MKTEPFVKGILTGKVKIYYPNGKISSETNFKYDMKNGIHFGYHENKKMREQGSFRNDQKDGKWIYYDNAGKAIKTETYSSGRLISSSEN